MGANVHRFIPEHNQTGDDIKQLTIISGKGGTGKTSITGAFATLAQKAVIADCDVDAADLHLLLKPQIQKTMKFNGLKIPTINKQKCTNCGRCIETCKFTAINSDMTINKNRCEGCGLCAYICPVDAIEMIDRESGESYISETRYGPMSHATLYTAEEASGKLVTVVRNTAKDLAIKHNLGLVLIDGPPGIGCPVIASITGVDLVLIITEPTLSAIHDLDRILRVSHHFNIPAVVCINKYTINPENSTIIEKYCENNNTKVVGKIPYDTAMTNAMVKEQTIIEYTNSNMSKAVTDLWVNVQKRLVN